MAVTVMVVAQVQPGTAADLEKPYRRIESVDQSQQTTDQRCRPAHLVGLRRLVKSTAQIIGMFGGGLHDVGPSGFGVPVPTDAGIPAAQRRRAAVENQPVQPTAQ